MDTKKYNLMVLNDEHPSDSQCFHATSLVITTPGGVPVTVPIINLQRFVNNQHVPVCKRPIQIGDVVEFIFNKDLITDQHKVGYRGFVNGGHDGVPLSIRTNFLGKLDEHGESRYINIDASLVTVTRVLSICMKHNLEWPVCSNCGEVLTDYQTAQPDKKV